MPEFSYAYHLPEELIASQLASPRDAARLFVYDTKEDVVTFDTFLNLDRYLPPDALLVLNNTKVAPARIFLKKETGGKVEALLLLNEWQGTGPIPAWLNRKMAIGAKLVLNAKKFFNVIRQNEDVFYLEPNFDPRDILAVLGRHGRTPIPNYIKGPGLSEAVLRKKYQTVFAERPALVAAPTASLHFTDRVLQKLSKQGIRRAFVTLDVGRGTFAPVREEQFLNGKLHAESLRIPASTVSLVREYKRENRPIVAVGTTAVRALESASEDIFTNIPAHMIEKKTQVFIRPPYFFHAVDILMTNFHLPSTSLMMLVEAFLRQKKARRNVVELYEMAIRGRFRFYSFGDAMLIL